MENILCFYEKDCDKVNLEIISKCINDYTFYITDSYFEAKKLYERLEHKIVIVDFTTQSGKDLLNYIISTNSEQKIITMSEKLECSVIQGCDYCTKNYKRRRVLKPINLKELIDTIRNYDNVTCPYINKFNDILTILDKVLSKYDSFEYHSEKHIISPTENASSHSILQELVEIIEILIENNIKYSIDGKYNIILND